MRLFIQIFRKTARKGKWGRGRCHSKEEKLKNCRNCNDDLWSGMPFRWKEFKIMMKIDSFKEKEKEKTVNE
jgi:hypothetical protein